MRWRSPPAVVGRSTPPVTTGSRRVHDAGRDAAREQRQRRPERVGLYGVGRSLVLNAARVRGDVAARDAHAEDRRRRHGEVLRSAGHAVVEVRAARGDDHLHLARPTGGIRRTLAGASVRHAAEPHDVAVTAVRRDGRCRQHERARRMRATLGLPQRQRHDRRRATRADRRRRLNAGRRGALAELHGLDVRRRALGRRLDAGAERHAEAADAVVRPSTSHAGSPSRQSTPSARDSPRRRARSPARPEQPVLAGPPPGTYA